MPSTDISHIIVKLTPTVPKFHRYCNSGDLPDPSQMVQWHISDEVGVWNWERWTDPGYDELYAAGLGETDEATRHEI